MRAGRFRDASPSKKFLFFVLVAAFLYGSFGFAPEGAGQLTAAAAQVLSLIGFSISYLGQRLTYNKHYMAMHGAGASLVAVSSFMLGTPSYAIMMGFASARFLTMAFLPSGREDFKMRATLACLFALAGAATMFGLGAFRSGWDYINLAAMMLATASNTMPSGDHYDMSHYSRFLISKAAALNVIYQIIRGHNIPAIIFEGLSVVNKYDVMNLKDVPNVDRNGRRMGTFSKWYNYMLSGLRKNKLLAEGYKIEP